MRCIDILVQEHQLIHRLLDGLEALLEEVRTTGMLDGSRALEALRLFEVFADGSHQEKEEACLFPALRRRDEAEARRLEVYLAEHAEERRRFASLRQHLEGASYAEPMSLDLFVLHGQGYVELHRAHMARETELVLPLAAERLTEHDDEWILRGFRGIEERSPSHAELLRRIEALGLDLPAARGMAAA